MGGSALERPVAIPPVASAVPAEAREDRTERAILLVQPARRDEVVTTADVVVRGRAGAGVAQIRVTLESRGGKILASRWIDRRASDGRQSFPFETSFEAPAARPAGVMWVTATGLGADGVPIDATRRRFQLGAIATLDAAPQREVVVRGRVAEGMGVVRIVLQSRTGTHLVSAAVDPTGHGHADWVPFESRFHITPDSDGAWPAYIVAVDADGRPIEPVRHPFNVRSYLFIPASSGPGLAAARSGHTTGEDGLMGGIPFGTNFLQEP